MCAATSSACPCRPRSNIVRAFFFSHVLSSYSILISISYDILFIVFCTHILSTIDVALRHTFGWEHWHTLSLLFLVATVSVCFCSFLLACAAVRQVVSECIDLSGAPRAMCLAFVNKHRQELEKALTGQGIRPKLRSDQRSSHNAALLAASTLAVSPDPESERRYSFTAVHSSRFMVNDMCVERGIDTSPRSSYIPCASAAANSTAVLEDAAGSIAEFASRKVDAILASVLADAAKTGAQKQKPPTTQSPPQPA
eukprot:TRINITY_DN1490_c0_g1_i2.p1 TRINITY_DN1490_c0_g1~~TRINITY_DN1490_c0_g1_i2.p1  ORF type:complete len:254 (-),score=44.84 TRINITY_DN1490_c0_g1_i2:322-1083(-)